MASEAKDLSVKYTPRSVAAFDQLDASVRDLFDSYEVDLVDQTTRKAVLVTVIACCQTIKRNDATPEQTILAMTMMLDAVIRLTEAQS